MARLMQVIQFQVVDSRAACGLEAWAEKPALHIAASTIEELHHEARDALMAHLGARHIAYRVQLKVGQRQMA